MGKHKTYRQNRKREKISTRKRILKGGGDLKGRGDLKGGGDGQGLYGIIPVVSYNNVTIEPGIDKNEYIKKNHIYPNFDDKFDINNAYNKVREFFRLSNDNNPSLKTRKIKIAMHTDKELREINVLNKMIRAVNNLINPIQRQDKNKTNLDALRSVGNPKIQFNALYGLTSKERTIAENLIRSGLFDKVLYYSPVAPKNQDTRPDYVIENERLKKINNDLTLKFGHAVQFTDVLKEAEKKEEQIKADRIMAERLAKEESDKKEAERLAAERLANEKEAERLAKEEEDKKIKVDDLVTFTNTVSPDNGKEAKVIKIEGNTYTIRFTYNNDERETYLKNLTKK